MIPQFRIGRVALLLPVVALGICGATLADARWIAPLSGAAERSDSLAIPPLPRRAEVLSEAAIQATVDRNPFRPDRARAPERYRLPGTVAVTPAAPAYTMHTPARPVITLQGTAAYGNGSGLAALLVPGKQPHLVRVGESFEGYRLTKVTPTAATLVGSDTTLVLHLPGHSEQAGKP